MKYTEETFKQKVDSLYNGEVEVISRFKGLTRPILVKDHYGVMRLDKAIQIINNRPGIKAALNKTQYFMSKLAILQPDIAAQLTPQSEYVAAKKDMLFLTKYGVVKTSPDTLLAGHAPTIRVAIDRKTYFKNQLLEIYGDSYDFKITSTDRHDGRVTLICPIHGEVSVDSDGIFLGVGCPKCNSSERKSNMLYFIELFDDTERFYKIGVAHYNRAGNIHRFQTYLDMGYNFRVIKLIRFDTYLEAHNLETKLRQVIKPILYTPKKWPNPTSLECFKDTKEVILDIINNDIVSTSAEMQSSFVVNGQEIAISTEDHEV